MNRHMLEVMREWVKAEIKAGIADSQPDGDGYYGTGYAENEEADLLFEQLLDIEPSNDSGEE